MDTTEQEFTLTEMLFPTPEQAEEQEYRRYFSRQLWSIEEFGALMVGMTPQRYRELGHSDDIKDIKDLKKSTEASKIISKFYKHHIKIKDIEGFHFFEKETYLSPWRFIKWIALNNIPIRKRFSQNLPLYLIEQYLFFQPDKIKSIAQGKNLAQFNKNLYQCYAREILEKHPNISR